MLKYEELKAKDLIKQAIILEPSQTLYDVRNMMIRYNISRVVIAKDNKPLGIITEKDIARFLYKEVPNRRLYEISVNEIMSKDLIKVGEQTNLDIEIALNTKNTTLRNWLQALYASPLTIQYEE